VYGDQVRDAVDSQLPLVVRVLVVPQVQAVQDLYTVYVKYAHNKHRLERYVQQLQGIESDHGQVNKGLTRIIYWGDRGRERK